MMAAVAILDFEKQEHDLVGCEMVRLFCPLYRRMGLRPISMETILVKYVYNNASGSCVHN